MSAAHAMSRACFSAVIIALSSGSAFAFCSQPSPGILFDFPEPYISEPTVPFCLSGYKYTGEHTCTEWEVDSYFSELEQYQSDLDSYISDVNDFMRKARRHAEEAEEYADCSMKEALAEIE